MERGRVVRRAGAVTWAVLLACVTLAACNSSHRFPDLVALDEAHLFGYSERALGGDRFEVSYRTREREASLDEDERDAEVSRDKEKARDFALWRAAILAEHHGFPAFSVLDSRYDVDVTIDAACSSYGFGCGGAYDPDMRDAWLRVHAVLKVQMYREPGRGAYGADAIVRRFEARYPNAEFSPDQRN